MTAMSKVIFGFSAAFNEMMQNMMTICEYSIKKIIVSVIEDVIEARQFSVAVSSVDTKNGCSNRVCGSACRSPIPRFRCSLQLHRLQRCAISQHYLGVWNSAQLHHQHRLFQPGTVHRQRVGSRKGWLYQSHTYSCTRVLLLLFLLCLLNCFPACTFLCICDYFFVCCQSGE